MRSTDQKGRIERKGGYEPGPKTLAELSPPPKNLGAGAKKPSGSERFGRSPEP
jgi:hypothetical protein